MGARMQRLEDLVRDGFERIEERLARIEAKENERRGAWGIVAGIWTIVTIILSATSAWLIDHFGK